MNLNTESNYQLTTTTELSLDEIQKRLFGATADLETDLVEEEATTENPDLLPSKRTIRASYEKSYEPTAPAKFALTKKVKVGLISYAAVVLCLIIGVAICSFLISGAFAQVGELQAEYFAKQEVISALESQIAEATDAETIIQAGLAMGFTEINNSNSYSYELLETRPAQTFQIETNWFDNFCDWLSQIFGG